MLKQKIKVGDTIQWQCNGFFILDPPAKVAKFSPCGRFLFIEGSDCGIPVTECFKEENENNV
jgi:hypothetical protein